MSVALRHYDFAAARARQVARVDRDKRLVYDARGAVDFDRTRQLRDLREGVRDALLAVERTLVRALSDLPMEDGGLRSDGAVRTAAMSADMPLVKALLILAAHPTYGDGLQRVAHALPGSDQFLARQPLPPYRLAALEDAVRAGVVGAYGDVTVLQDRLADEQAPGSPLGIYLTILARTARYDAIGALDPSFSRRDSLAGEWWLLQPVSPRLQHDEVASRVGLELCGFLPPKHVDVEGRVVMVCYPRDSMTNDARAEKIAETKWINGFERVIWRPGHGPLANEGFDLLEKLAGVTESSYGPYLHSTELPPYPPSKDGPDDGAHARMVAHAMMEALGAPEDPNADATSAQDDRRKSAIFEASYLRSAQVKPKPPREFSGPARTRAELVFAASLEHCVHCDDRLDPSTIRLRDTYRAGRWEVFGLCIRCGAPRAYRYAAVPELENATALRYELGPGPSRMISAALFEETLRRALPLIAPEPERLDANELRQSSEANRRALTSLNELVKLGETDAARIAERDRQIALRAAHDAAGAASSQNVAARATGRARSIAEMNFTVELVPCVGCGRRSYDGLMLFGDDDLWSLIGPCPACHTSRAFYFRTSGAPYLSTPKGYELGHGPSDWITESELRAEHARVASLVVPDATTLAPEAWRVSANAMNVARTCLEELAKLAPEDRDLSAERDQLVEIGKRYRADAERVEDLENPGFDLLGSSADETRLLVHRGAGYSIPIPGRPKLAEPNRDSALKLDARVIMRDVPIEIGFRLDELPSNLDPAPLAASLATAFATTRAAQPPTVRRVGKHTAVSTYELAASGLHEHVRVMVRAHAEGRRAIYAVFRFSREDVSSLQWVHVRSAMTAEEQWDDAPRKSAPPLWPKASTLVAVPASLALTPEAHREAIAKAKDLGAMTRDDVLATTEVMLDFATNNDQPPTAPQPALLLDMIRGHVTMRVSERAASVLLRNLGDVATMHDLRAWCSQCIWAVDKSS